MNSLISTFNKAKEREDGFTLIEILVVVLIIGILAAIAIPVFLNQRQKANDASVQSDIRNGITAAETYFKDNPTATKVELAEIRKLMSKDTGTRITWTGGANDYCVEAQHNNGAEYKTQWTYSSLTGQTRKGNIGGYSCSNYGVGYTAVHVIWYPNV